MDRGSAKLRGSRANDEDIRQGVDPVTSAVIEMSDLARTECAHAERFRALVDEHQDAAIRTARRLLGGDPAAEDVAQEAFLRAYKGLPQFRGEASLRTWFFRILVREVQRHRRWQSMRKVWSTESLSERELPDSPPPTGDFALRDRIVRALERLPRRQRETFVLVHLEQFTVKETASLLGVSLGTIKVHLHRALKALRSDLADLREPEAVESDAAKKGATP